jgi:toxin ParE1/3/4
MMGDVRVDLAQSALDDLADIIEWYTAQGVPHVGVRLVTEIRERLRQLAEFPDSGRTVPEFDTPWLRELEHPPLRIVYRRDEGAVTVVRVWRSERLMDPGLPGNA